ncbi:unnamed protein product [Notodromas monacha]|uniref:Uncharacterized protein n=1 Tax=Notodromas monacha TaxID=399045 RepID=A0A7R9BS22_9CRUS|nr:unnamed protein product [Notodromas monacha]CAG0919722.1 unnamed protein product [Notodromas monacha]
MKGKFAAAENDVLDAKIFFVLHRCRVNHKDWRKLMKKLKRKKKRQKTAQDRDSALKQELEKLLASAEYKTWLLQRKQLQEEAEEKMEMESEKMNAEWQRKEVEAQQKFAWQRAREVAKAEAEERQRLEWLKLQEEAQEKLKKETEAKESCSLMLGSLIISIWLFEHAQILANEKLQEVLRKEAPLRNPDAPAGPYKAEGNPVPFCAEHERYGLCRFGAACRRYHMTYASASVIAIPDFFTHFALTEGRKRGEYDTDISLEFEESDIRKHFLEFWDEVYPELSAFGQLGQVKVCCNSGLPLRGAVFAQYQLQSDAVKAQTSLHGRWFAGRQINVFLVRVPSWRRALCGPDQHQRAGGGGVLRDFPLGPAGGKKQLKIILGSRVVLGLHPGGRKEEESPALLPLLLRTMNTEKCDGNGMIESPAVPLFSCVQI